MTAQFARALNRQRPGPGVPTHEPHAALLIDFDNVTMGIRSDLTKELKNLLNSDIIKGKVAVQRAYADWRRYPQYIVPLAESSVDLIFAPAYGSAKKNATDIRLAIDAVELVFTRPEIGTIILLSGDSDFSSLVLKLKEYGKYVIGVGIRESASDLLVQNCDEYYSYSALTGLTRAGDESPVISEDPWELVEMSLRQMIENNDVMRSDRLKQVLLELDPGFDEKTLGFQKFNKFLTEAASRGIISLRKQENGQYEVGPPTAEAMEAAAEGARGDSREGRSRRGRRGRGRRDEHREPREVQEDLVAAASRDADDGPDVGAALTEPAAGAGTAAAAQPVAAGAEEGTGKQIEQAATADRAEPAPITEGARIGTLSVAGDGADGLAAAYDLLRRATADLVRRTGSSARDSDVKRRMLELQAGWDEATLGFSKFSRFLRQAHDAEVVTLQRGDNGNYDVVPGNNDVPQMREERDARGGRRERGRGRGREAPRDTTPVAPAGVPETAEVPATPVGATQATEPASRSAPPAAKAAPSTAPPTERAPEAAKPAARQPAATQAAIGFRRGSRGRAAPSGPPPLLEGQTASVRTTTAGAGPAGGAEGATPQAAASAPTPGSPRKSARKAAKKTASPAPGKAAMKKAPGRESVPTDPAPGRQTAGPARKAAAKGSASASTLDIAALGLPREAGEVASYIAANYKGVGPKSVQALMERFGASRVFTALQTRPDEVREVMGAARGDLLLEAWADDVAARRANAARPDAATPARPASPARSHGRRGGRGRSRPSDR